MRSFTVLGAAALLTVLSCKKEKGVASAPSAASYDRVDTAPLWKMIPADARAAVVVSEGTLGHLHDAALVVFEDLKKSPLFADEVAKIIAKEPGISMALVDGAEDIVGADLSKGAALYMLERGKVVALLPITKPAVAMAMAEGKQQGDVDVYDKFVCKTHQGYYACAESESELGSLNHQEGMKPPSPKMQGHVEIVVGSELLSEAYLPAMPITDVESVRVAMRFEPGGVTAEVHLDANITGITGAKSKQRLFGNIAKQGPSGLFTADVSDMYRNWIGSMPEKMRSAPVPLPGLTKPIKIGDVLTALDGNLAGYTLPGTPAGVLMIGLADSTVAKELLSACPSFSKPPELVSTYEQDRCRITATYEGVDVSATLWIEDNALKISMGDLGAKRPAVALGRMGKEILDEPWMAGVWGYGLLTASEGLESLAKVVPMPRPLETEVARGVWAMAHLVEYGLAIRYSESGLTIKTRFRTTWSYNDEERASLNPLTERIATGDVSAATEIRALAKKHPNGKLASDLRGGVGLLAPSMLPGILAAVAIPAFQKYISKSKGSEAKSTLRRGADGARAYAATHGKYPAESTPITPVRGSCCSSVGEKCLPNEKLWQHPSWVALGVAMTGPHRYSYQYEVSADGKQFTLRAFGDLDCDQEYSSFELGGSIDASGTPTIGGDIRVTRELE